MLQNDPIRRPPFHFDADPDPDRAFHFDVDPDPAFHFDTDLDPASQNDPDPQHWQQDFSKGKALCMFGIKKEFDNSKIAKMKILKNPEKVGSDSLSDARCASPGARRK